MPLPIPETVNLHLWPRCNQACTYCFERFREVRGSMPNRSWMSLLDHLRERGVRRVNFAGGEPTLHPNLEELLMHAKGIGLEVSIVTNAHRLTERMLSHLDVVALSIDSNDDAVSARLGRRVKEPGSYRQLILSAADRVHDAGVRLKVNTVVSACNWQEDLTGLYLALSPAKLKLLQFTEVPGENAEEAPALRVTTEQFAQFVDRHRSLVSLGIWVVPEAEVTVLRSYVMINPSGRVFQVGPVGHVVSQPVIDVGLEAAIEQAGGYDRPSFEGRGGNVGALTLRLGRRDER